MTSKQELPVVVSFFFNLAIANCSVYCDLSVAKYMETIPEIV